MSASLDDMPPYEHFQDELDLELKRYQQIRGITDTYIEHTFIQYLCFSIFLKTPEELSSVILKHILSDIQDEEERILRFLEFINNDPGSVLKGKFSTVLNDYKE